MPKKIIDCQGLDCPEPVIRARRLIDEEGPEELGVIVDNKAALENVSRLLGNKGYGASHTERDGLYEIAGKRQGVAAGSGPADLEGIHCPAPDAGAREEQGESTLVFISSQYFGSGDNELGERLMRNFLLTLPELGESLWRIILVNGGVKLAVSGSPVLAELQAMEKSGTSILVCGACLDFFKLLEQKAVGQTTNMLDVVTSMQLADKIIQI